MNTRNRVHLIGFVGQNPTVKQLDNNKVVARLSMGTPEAYTNRQGERVEETQWHNIVAWGKTAEIIEKFVEKSSEIAIDGKLVSRSYDDKEGNKRYITEVVVSDLLLLGSRKKKAA